LRTLKACEEILAALQAAPRGKNDPGGCALRAYPPLISYHPFGVKTFYTLSLMDESAQPFDAHVELLQLFLLHRDEIVERIQELLNAQRKPIQYLQDVPLLSRHFEDCFFTLLASPASNLVLRGQLEEAHWASGFKPRKSPGLHNDLVDPAEMMVRAFHLWRQTHWPGHNGRVRYAHTLFNLYVIRCLALLSMRCGMPDRTASATAIAGPGLLDQLWKITPANQPVLVRDARWLIPWHRAHDR
jgi:hypothetical protein